MRRSGATWGPRRGGGVKNATTTVLIAMDVHVTPLNFYLFTVDSPSRLINRPGAAVLRRRYHQRKYLLPICSCNKGLQTGSAPVVCPFPPTIAPELT
jgi:hypothetical protein